MTKEEWGDQDSIRSDPVARPRPPALGLFAIGPLTPLSTSTVKAGSGVDMFVAKPGSAFIAPADLDSLSGAYPLAPAVLRHGLADHPLLTLSALADAASEMPAEHVERRIADAVNGGDFAMDTAAHAPEIGRAHV